MGHAWVEDIRGDLVFAVTLDIEAVPKKSYYDRFSVTRTSMYSMFEAFNLNKKHEHHGPWEDWLGEQQL